MCGIFGIIGKTKICPKEINKLINFAFRRGQDSSGIMYYDSAYKVKKADFDIKKLKKRINLKKTSIVLGIARLITNGNNDNQPFLKKNAAVFHNGIIINDKKLFNEEGIKKTSEIDSEIILSLAQKYLKKNSLHNTAKIVLKKCSGTLSAALIFYDLGKLILLSNNGSLYFAEKDGFKYYSSELCHLKTLGCKNITKLVNQIKIIDIPKNMNNTLITEEYKLARRPLIPKNVNPISNSSLLEKIKPKLVRCTKCLLPHTMPFIKFDEKGICNYCHSYKKNNKPRPFNELIELIKPYRKDTGDNCIVPFSGGRDSSFALHLIVKKLKLKPVTYTYDWGMTSDVGRRNISIMCSKLGIENIIVAADIKKKRDNIKKNVEAWLKNPHLGMISLFTAGDKHFFKYVEHIKKETKIKLHIWGDSPFEVTHFKAGFLGVEPNLNEKRVYSKGLLKQLNYQSLRFKQMFKSLGYFNTSLWDTLSGEYYRSIKNNSNYLYIFDYWKWNENEIDKILLNEYQWEFANDTKTSWRIGDGTAAFYNYIYHTVAGFTEHDTFRSNQIREGEIF